MHGLERRFVEFGGGLGEAQMGWLQRQLQVSAPGGFPGEGELFVRRLHMTVIGDYQHWQGSLAGGGLTLAENTAPWAGWPAWSNHAAKLAALSSQAAK
jgi:hypothetical protein